MECKLKIVQNGWIEKKSRTILASFIHAFFKKFEISFNFSKEIDAPKIKKSGELRGAPAPLNNPPGAGAFGAEYTFKFSFSVKCAKFSSF